MELQNEQSNERGDYSAFYELDLTTRLRDS